MIEDFDAMAADLIGAEAVLCTFALLALWGIGWLAREGIRRLR